MGKAITIYSELISCYKDGKIEGVNKKRRRPLIRPWGITEEEASGQPHLLHRSRSSAAGGRRKTWRKAGTAAARAVATMRGTENPRAIQSTR